MGGVYTSMCSNEDPDGAALKDTDGTIYNGLALQAGLARLVKAEAEAAAAQPGDAAVTARAAVSAAAETRESSAGTSGTRFRGRAASRSAPHWTSSNPNGELWRLDNSGELIRPALGSSKPQPNGEPLPLAPWC